MDFTDYSLYRFDEVEDVLESQFQVNYNSSNINQIQYIVPLFYDKIHSNAGHCSIE
jgi:hypothetical protein